MHVFYIVFILWRILNRDGSYFDMNWSNIFVYNFWMLEFLCGELVSAWPCALVSPYAVDNNADTTIQAWRTTEDASNYDYNHEK